MLDLQQSDDRMRLIGAVKQSLREKLPFDRKRKEAYEQFVGFHYGENGGDKVPLNFIELAANIYRRALVASSPAALVVPPSQSLVPQATSFELAVNKTLRDIDFEGTMMGWVMEALFAPMGVLKIGLDVDSVEEIEGVQVWYGPPNVELVLWDDWVHDLNARSMSKISFCGNRYFLEREDALLSGLYDPEAVKQYPKTEEGGGREIESHPNIDMVRDENSVGAEDYRDMLEVWDIYLPKEGLIVTLSLDHPSLPPLRIIEWSGPKDGPYRFLQFEPVPGTTIPLPPVSLWMDIHKLSNRMFNKLGRQADRQKTVLLVHNSATDDGRRITEASDGEAISVSAAAGQVSEFTTGGADQVSLGFLLQLKQLFSYFAGNLEALGGLGAMSGTVGQDQLLTQSASQRVQSMQKEVYCATKKVLQDIGWYLWTDELAQIPITKKIQGTQQTVQSTWTPGMMQGEFMDYQIDIQPYSLQARSPEERLNSIKSFFIEILLPAIPLLEQQGITPNMEVLIKAFAKLSNIPEMNDLVSYANAKPGDDEEGPMKTPSTTTRKYVRTSQPGKTDRGAEQVMMQALFGGESQMSEKLGAVM